LIRGKLVIGSYGTGSFTHGTVTQDQFVFIIYGGTEEVVTARAIEILKEITGVANPYTSEAYQRDFSELPAAVLQKLDEGEDFGFSLDYDPYENVAGASWRMKSLHGDPTIILE
jgi:hypothetical protein